ncbi:MAG: hypothetical protein MI920_18425 [Kiloniellales bacterium]|nr:hypothetical protein [Kiloniellales bacterium]
MEDPIILATLVLFFIALPFANALLDWLSLLVSRALGRHLQRLQASERLRLWVLGWHVLADLFAAALFLSVLTMTIPLVIALANMAWGLLADGGIVDLRALIDRAATDPGGCGFR